MAVRRYVIVMGSGPADSKKHFILDGSPGAVKSPLAEVPRTHDLASPHMAESERLSKLRHDLSNPLSALLAEVQLLLLNESQYDPETLTSLREIEALAIRMRAMLRDI
jgi:hypothetical protein